VGELDEHEADLERDARKRRRSGEGRSVTLIDIACVTTDSDRASTVSPPQSLADSSGPGTHGPYAEGEGGGKESC
jgi:hypothetical protein